MRVMLFRNGQCGEMVNLVGEYPLEEMGELLGGKADERLLRLDGRLSLVVRSDREGLPRRYEMARPGEIPQLIGGDCVVVRKMSSGQQLGDVNIKDAEMARMYVRPVRGEEDGKREAVAV